MNLNALINILIPAFGLVIGIGMAIYALNIFPIIAK